MINDSLLIACGSGSGLVGVQQTDLGVGITGLDVSHTYYSAAFSPDGAFLALGHASGGKLSIINTSDWSEVPATPYISYNVEDCAFSPDGAHLAAVYFYGNTLTVINTADWSVVAGTPSMPGTTYGCSFSMDNNFLAIAHGSGNNLTILNTTDWSAEAGTPVLPGASYTCAFSPDGDFLAVGHTGGNRLTIINTADWSVVAGTPSLTSDTRYCAFSPGGDFLALANSSGNRLTIINTADWSVVAGTPALPSTGYGCAFSPDGSLLAVGHDAGNSLTIINTADWSVVADTPALPATGRACAFSPTSLITPGRKVETKDYSGAYIAATVSIVDRNLSLIDTINSLGALNLYRFKESDLWLIMKDDRPGATSDAFARIILDANSGDLPPLVLTQGYIGDLVTISSNLTTQAGAPGDEVVIRNWTTRELVAKVIPDANGDWSAQVPPGTYDVSYIAENCAPVIHGPYTVELP